MIIFREKASQFFKVIQEEEIGSAIINAIARHIVLECSTLKTDSATYKTSVDKNIATKRTSSTLLHLLSCISNTLISTLPAILIGNIVTSYLANLPTSLQLSPGLLAREKSIILNLYDLEVTCLYEEILRFVNTIVK